MFFAGFMHYWEYQGRFAAEVVTVEVATPLPTDVPMQGSDNPLFAQAAPAGSAVDIGNKMTLTILDATRPAVCCTNLHGCAS